MLDNRVLFLLFLIFVVVTYGFMNKNNYGQLINIDEESGVGEIVSPISTI